ncbi:MAG: glycosyltransferase [Rhodothermales bacterium]
MLGVQCAYWIALRIGFRHAARRTNDGGTLAPLTVVVAARNEETRLPVLLDGLEKQTHPNFEVIVVDDGSIDRTAGVVDARRPPYRLRLIRHEGGNKKRALSRGIEAAEHDLLALTDADCEPPPGWLASLARAHTAAENPSVLIGYSPFRRGTGSLMQRLACFETFVTGFLTAAAAGLDRPYMAVGRNISYPRHVFRKVDGFEPIMHSLSGDDDLLVQEIVRRSAADVRALLDPESFVPTAPPATWKEWLRQKRRHASAGRHYPPGIQAHLTLFHGTNLLTWLAPVFLGWMGTALLVLRLAVQFGALAEGARRLGEERLLSALPVLDLLYVLYNTVVAPLALLFQPRKW